MAGSASGWKVVDSPFLGVKLFFFNMLVWVPDEPLRAFVRLPGLFGRPMPQNLTRRLRMRQSRPIGRFRRLFSEKKLKVWPIRAAKVFSSTRAARLAIGLPLGR